MTELSFQRPLLFLLVFPAVILLVKLYWRWQKQQYESSVCDPHLAEVLCHQSSGSRPAAVLWLGLIWLIAILLLAGPTWNDNGHLVVLKQSHRILVVDLSEANTPDDLSITQLQELAREVVTHSTDTAFAMIAFAEFPYLIAPFSTDKNILKNLIDDLHPDIMPVQGNRPDRAIEMSRELLSTTGQEEGEIIIVTPGMLKNPDNIAAPEKLYAENVLVFSLNKTTQLQQWADQFGGPVRIAEGGELSENDLSFLNPEQSAQSTSVYRTARALWLLIPLLLLVSAGYGRGYSHTVALISVLCILWPEGRAHASSQVVGTELLEKAEVLYQQGAYQQAARLWQDLEGPDAQFNLGNALVHLGEYEKALKAYEAVLQRHPEATDARLNYMLVSEYIQQDPDEPPPADEESTDPQDEPAESREQENPERSSDENPASSSLPEADDTSTSDDQIEDRSQQTTIEPGNSDPAGNQTESDQFAQYLLEGSDLGDWLQRVPDQPRGYLKSKLLQQHWRRGYATDSMETP